jgi:hypothetical protein
MGVGKSTFAFTNTAITLDGGSTTINITRDNQSYSHKLSHGYGTIATLAVGTTSYTWKPTAAQLTKFFEEVPNQKTRQIDVYLDTYNGSTLVGRDVHALTVTLSEATGKATISGFAINDGNSTTSGWGIVVDGKSALSIAKTVTAKYGANITKAVFTYGSNEFMTIDDLVGSLPLTAAAKSYNIGYKVTDSRGFVTTASVSKSCARYEAPMIDTLEMVRCDSSGNETEAGTKAKAIVKGSWASIGGKNTATFKLGYKLQNGTSYTYQTITVTNGVVNVEQILSVTLSADSDYLFAVSLVDGLGGSFTEESIGFSNSKNIMYVSADGEELILGSSSDGNILIGPDHVDIRKGENVRASFEADRITLGDGYLRVECIDADGGTGKWTGIKAVDPLVKSMELAIDDGTNHGNWIALSLAQKDKPSGTGSTPIAGYASLHADHINFKAAQSLTYDIPVLNSGDCNTLTRSGKWYLANGSINRPIDKNGWLETKLYSTTHCHQTYTTYTGEIYTRMMQAGTWGGWNNGTIAMATSGTSAARHIRLGPVHIIGGSWVATGIGKNYIKITDDANLKSQFGFSSFDPNKCVAHAMSISGSFVVQGITRFPNDGYYAYFNGVVGTGAKVTLTFVYMYFDF